MKKVVPFLIVALVLLATPVLAEKSFPDLELSGKLSEKQKEYLGVAADSFKLSDIKADYLFVEGYSMYCPVCQRDATRLNDVYKAVSLMDSKGSIKFLGLALGNTQFEVEFYKKKYTVEFPLFQDEEYEIHKALGEVPTPVFYIVKLGPTMEVVYEKVGEAENKDVLLKAIKETTGLK